MTHKCSKPVLHRHKELLLQLINKLLSSNMNMQMHVLKKPDLYFPLLRLSSIQ